MKKYFVILLFFIGLSASAQYYPQYYQDGSRYNGVDRSLTGQQYEHKRKRQPEKQDKVEFSVQKLTEDLSLDSFQAAVIRDLLESNKKEEDIIIAQSIPDESKIEKIIALREKMNGKIKEMLSPEQQEKFSKLGQKKKK